ncbi:MAG TPA: RecX family transcriptional regulator [Bacteroidetes bacterium]|nr:RecX family transcriptional regulator [Bacteroidota bacterium]
MTEPSFILDKARKYCAYRERCIFDVKQKLLEWNVSEKTIRKVIQQLEEEDYINEERYAVSFAVGKLRNNKWGKNKIFYELSKKNIPEIYVQMGLSEIDEQEYIQTLKTLLASKRINDNDEYRRNNKLVRYVMQKGYLSDLAWQIIRGEI